MDCEACDGTGKVYSGWTDEDWQWCLTCGGTGMAPPEDGAVDYGIPYEEEQALVWDDDYCAD